MDIRFLGRLHMRDHHPAIESKNKWDASSTRGGSCPPTTPISHPRTYPTYPENPPHPTHPTRIDTRGLIRLCPICDCWGSSECSCSAPPIHEAGIVRRMPGQGAGVPGEGMIRARDPPPPSVPCPSVRCNRRQAWGTGITIWLLPRLGSGDQSNTLHSHSPPPPTTHTLSSTLLYTQTCRYTERGRRRGEREGRRGERGRGEGSKGRNRGKMEERRVRKGKGKAEQGEGKKRREWRGREGGRERGERR